MNDNFNAVDVPKIMRSVVMHLFDIIYEQREDAMHDLDNYIVNLREHKMFADTNDISKLEKNMVKTKKLSGYYSLL